MISLLTASAVACAGLLLSLRTTDDEPFSTPLPLFIYPLHTST
jgi:hypothetical protein